MLKCGMLSVLLFGVLALGAGCAAQRTAYDIRLMALDAVSEDYIHYISHRRLRLTSGQLGVEVTFVNLHSTDNVAIDWRLVFYDRDRFQIEETEWNTTVFPPREETVVRANSIHSEAVDFVVQIRGAQI